MASSRGTLPLESSAASEPPAFLRGHAVAAATAVLGAVASRAVGKERAPAAGAETKGTGLCEKCHPTVKGLGGIDVVADVEAPLVVPRLEGGAVVPVTL